MANDAPYVFAVGILGMKAKNNQNLVFLYMSYLLKR